MSKESTTVITKNILSREVTDQVSFGNNDDECLPITKCICGTTFTPWDFIISIYSDIAHECPECKRRLYFSNSVRIYQVMNGETEDDADTT